ncbi:MAG TPA: hypothetical protein VF142_05870 [Longimicrobium sp.]
MKKLVLELDDLNVQSFATTGGARGPRGTVRAHETETCVEQHCTDVCSLVLTCASCEGTCDQACQGDDTVDENRRIILY